MNLVLLLTVIINLGKSREIFFYFFPFPTQHQILKIFCIEKESRFLLQSNKKSLKSIAFSKNGNSLKSRKEKILTYGRYP